VSFGKYRVIALDGKKLVILVIVSNELLADAPMLEAHLRRVFAAEISYQLDKAILLGSGAGVPQLFSKSHCRRWVTASERTPSSRNGPFLTA